MKLMLPQNANANAISILALLDFIKMTVLSFLLYVEGVSF